MTHKLQSFMSTFHVAAASLLLLVSFGCSRNNTMTSSNENLQRERSLELEAYHQSPNAESGNLKIETPVADNNTSTLETTATPSVENTHSIITSASKPASSIEAKAHAKAEKVKKLMEKKTIKIKKSLEKTNALNGNLKLGLILILVGILIAVILGSLVNGSIFGAIGAIIAVIGIVFLILGLLEM